MHPALLDAALHIAAHHGLKDATPGHNRLPVAYGGVRLHASGAAALRVRLVLHGPDELSLYAADETGAPVVSVASLLARLVSADRLRPADHDSLFTVTWTEVTAQSSSARPSSARPPGDEADVLRVTGAGSATWPRGRPARTRQPGARRGPQVARRGQRPAPGRRHQYAVAATPDESPNPVVAPIWGWSSPYRPNIPGGCSSWTPTTPHRRRCAARWPPSSGRGAAPGRTERGLFAPRLARAAAHDGTSTGLEPRRHGADHRRHGRAGRGARPAPRADRRTRNLVLLGRSGQLEPGLHEELTGLGAHVTVAAGDAADRTAVAAVLAAVPEDRPLTAVVHAAAVVDDGLVESLTEERVDRVLRQADGAWVLHELTRGHDLAAFVVYSSAAGLLGGPGQSSYIAANALPRRAGRDRRALRAAGSVAGLGTCGKARPGRPRPPH